MALLAVAAVSARLLAESAARDGYGVVALDVFGDADTRHAILLTLTVVPVAVGLNLVFGIAAAWAIARFDFPGRTLLTALIDLPFSVSPVVAGLMFVLIFGLQGLLGPFLLEHGIKIIFALPGLVLATLSGQHIGQHVVCNRVFRINLYGCVEMRNRLVISPCILQKICKIDVRLKISRP